MIEFKQKFSLTNGNKINKKNWSKIKAVALNPCTNIFGVTEIEREKAEKGVYYCQYNLVRERDGYIFREIYSKHGINGHHESVRKAVWNALRHVKVYMEE